MRTENIEVTFKIPIPVDKPDLNGVIYSKEAIRNAYKDKKVTRTAEGWLVDKKIIRRNPYAK